MIVRGARNLVLVSRSGVRTPFQRYRLKRMRMTGCNIEISTQSVLKMEGCIKVVKSSQEMGTLGGVFNLALVLDDNMFEKQTPEAFWKVYGCKGDVTRYFDYLSRNCSICPEPLDYFVCFSSLSNRIGISQSNYNLANSVMERVCENRRRDGLHGLAIQWGIFGDVG